jgi:hypothetical protein
MGRTDFPFSFLPQARLTARAATMPPLFDRLADKRLIGSKIRSWEASIQSISNLIASLGVLHSL